MEKGIENPQPRLKLYDTINVIGEHCLLGLQLLCSDNEYSHISAFNSTRSENIGILIEVVITGINIKNNKAFYTLSVLYKNQYLTVTEVGETILLQHIEIQKRLEESSKKEEYNGG